jgi:hypothetical protein
MKKAYLVAALAGAALLGLNTGLLAAVAGEFGNYCAMGLVNGEKKLTDCSISEKEDRRQDLLLRQQRRQGSFLKDPGANIA